MKGSSCLFLSTSWIWIRRRVSISNREMRTVATRVRARRTPSGAFYYWIEIRRLQALNDLVLYFYVMVWILWSQNEVFPSSIPEFCKMVEINTLGSVETKLRDVQFYRFLTPWSDKWNAQQSRLQPLVVVDSRQQVSALRLLSLPLNHKFKLMES